MIYLLMFFQSHYLLSLLLSLSYYTIPNILMQCVRISVYHRLSFRVPCYSRFTLTTLLAQLTKFRFLMQKTIQYMYYLNLATRPLNSVTRPFISSTRHKCNYDHNCLPFTNRFNYFFLCLGNPMSSQRVL